MNVDALKKEARQKGTSQSRMLEIAALSQELARYIARRDKTPPAVLSDLARHADKTTRRHVAGNPAADAQTLERLSGDAVWQVAKAVAGNYKAPLLAWEALSHHPQTGVRLALAQHSRLPKSVLDILVRDVTPEVQREALIWNHKALTDAEVNALALGSVPAALTLLERSERLTCHTLEVLATHEHPQVRQALAQQQYQQLHNGKIPVLNAEIHARLGQDEDPGVRAASMPLLTDQQRWLMGSDPDPLVRRKAAYWTDSLEQIDRLIEQAEPSALAGLLWSFDYWWFRAHPHPTPSGRDDKGHRPMDAARRRAVSFRILETVAPPVWDVKLPPQTPEQQSAWDARYALVHDLADHLYESELVTSELVKQFMAWCGPAVQARFRQLAALEAESWPLIWGTQTHALREEVRELRMAVRLRWQWLNQFELWQNTCPVLNVPLMTPEGRPVPT